MVYQNIVPSITKLLNYDRTKTVVAIALGSFLPMVMYIAWIYGVLSGAVSTENSTTSGFLYDGFSIASIIGCSIACIMSIAEEFESFLKIPGGLPFVSPTLVEDEFCDLDEEGMAHHAISEEQTKGSILSVPSVVLAVVPALFAAIMFSNCSGSGSFTAALSAAGGYGSPLLYGVIPIVLAATQRYGDNPDEVSDEVSFEPLVPGGVFSLGLVGVSSGAFFMQEVFSDLTACFAAAS